MPHKLLFTPASSKKYGSPILKILSFAAFFLLAALQLHARDCSNIENCSRPLFINHSHPIIGSEGHVSAIAELPLWSQGRGPAINLLSVNQTATVGICMNLSAPAIAGNPAGKDTGAGIIQDQAVLTLAFAGKDTATCSGSVYTIADATAENAASVLWTTSGTGAFDNATIVNPTYAPSQSDILDGYVILTMQVTSGVPIVTDTDEMTLTISGQAIVNAGQDVTICENDAFSLSQASQQFATALHWSTSGTGTFNDAGIINPVYTPGTEDLASGSVILTITAMSASPCEAVTDETELSFSRRATVNAGADGSVCAGADFEISGATAANYTSVLWTTSGTGTFDNPALLNPVYLPGNNDIDNGQVILTFVVEPATACASATDQLVLIIAGLPLAFAGPDLSVCQDEQLQIIGASAASYSAIYWTTTGQGSIIGMNTLMPTYVPSPKETGNIVLRLNVIGPEACGGLVVSDEMILTLKTQVIANAGADQTIQYGSGSMLTGSASNGSDSYVYSWQPSSLLFDFNATNPETKQLTGNTVFILLVSDVVTGCQDTDTMMVFIDGINYAPVASDDYDTTRFNTPVTINISFNDSDPENGVLTFSFKSYPANGLVVLNSNNTITFTPYKSFTGDDSLSYRICDDGIPVMCAEAKIFIHILPEPDINDMVIYNGVSPNDDGNNDIWKIKGIDGFPDNEVQLFNRWGDKINEFSHYDNVNVVWDATNNKGEKVPDGTYYYILEIRDVKTFTGWIYVRSED